MPVLATMGLKKIYVAPAKKERTMPEYGSAWLDFGDVYQQTCKLKDSDPEVTVHKSETSNKKISVVGETETTIELSLMDPDLELMARYFGGKVENSGSVGQRKWVRPRKMQYKEWAVQIQPEEGLFVGCAVVRIIPKFEISYDSKGICLVPIKIIFEEETTFDEKLKNPTKSGGTE